MFFIFPPSKSVFFHGVFTSVSTVHLTAISGPLQYPSHGSTSAPGAPPNTPGPWIQDSLPSRILDPGSKAPGLGRAPKNRQVPGSGIFCRGVQTYVHPSLLPFRADQFCWLWRAGGMRSTHVWVVARLPGLAIIVMAAVGEHASEDCRHLGASSVF